MCMCVLPYGCVTIICYTRCETVSEEKLWRGDAWTDCCHAANIHARDNVGHKMKVTWSER
jgi:hypothetical protein